MYPLFVRLLLVVAGLACGSFAMASPIAEHVFIISFDGGKPEVMQQSEMPVLMDTLHNGAGTWNAQTIFPSITLVSHTSMLTGVSPKKHHVLWNDYRVEKGFVTVPTVFSLAKAAGFSTALFAGKGKFQHLNVPDTVDHFAIPGYEAQGVADAAAAYIKEAKPNVCFIHFADGDGAGHQFGWGTPEQIAAFGNEDKALKTVRDAIHEAGLDDTSVLILSADHGGHDKTHGSNDPVDMTIPWIAWGKDVKKGATIDAPVTTYDTAATALWLLGVGIPAEFDGKPVTSAFDVPADAAPVTVAAAPAH